MRALSDIEQEIEQYGEPANPGLGRAVVEAYHTLKVGGAIVGFRGMGKTLLANLSALAIGRPAVVIDAAKLLTVEGEVRLEEISSCRELNEVGNSLRRWLEGLVGGVVQRADCNIVVRVEGRGLERLKALAKQLKEFHIVLIFDSFEDLALRPEKYGYTVPRLLEDFFDLVDTTPAPLALPVELWTQLDLQIKSRIAPVHVIRWEVEHMRQFLRRLCQCELGPLEQVEFRNPRAVVTIAEELRRSSPKEVIEKRFDELRRVAREVAPRSAGALFEILKELWTRQDIYADLPKKRTKLLVRGLSGYSLSSHIIERIRAYVYECDECHHLIYELLL